MEYVVSVLWCSGGGGLEWEIVFKSMLGEGQKRISVSCMLLI